MTTWEPQTYLRYADIRFRAGLDLITRIPSHSYSSIYDLGCGTGYLSNVLAEKFPSARVTGIDSSPEMLAEARREFPSISWLQSDITSWHPDAPPNLIFSNAALQWVPDHKILFPTLLQMLQPDGILAVQMPRHFETPSHLALRDLVLESKWREQLEPLLLTPVFSPKTYWNLLSPHAADIDIWETIYQQVLDGPNPVVDFLRGSALRPFLSVLPEKDASQFVDAFAERMALAYPRQPDGKTLFPFRRLFLIAHR